MNAVLAIIQALVAAVPGIIELVKKGRRAGDIKLGEVVSTDALAKLEAAKDDAENFITNG